MIKYDQKFLKIKKDLKLYLIKFKKNRFRKIKNYPDNYTINDNIC